MTRRLLALLVGLLVAALGGELGVRLVEPPLRLQVVRGSEVELDLHHGAVAWVPRQHERRRNEACEGRHVVVLGSSILYGSGVGPDQVFSTLMERDGLCLHNLSAPGFDLGAKLASLAAWEAEHPVDEVWIELWDADVSGYTLLGPDAWRLPPGTRVDASGAPDAFGLPGNSWLFAWSRLYQLATSSVVPVGSVPTEEIWGDLVDRAAASLEGREVVVLVAPRLDRPFADSLTDDRGWAAAGAELALRTDARLVDLARLLVDEDHLALRADPCCHYAPAGHAALAEGLGRVLLDGRTDRPEP